MPETTHHGSTITVWRHAISYTDASIEQLRQDLNRQRAFTEMHSRHDANHKVVQHAWLLVSGVLLVTILTALPGMGLIIAPLGALPNIAQLLVDRFHRW